jgi:hypothetical protein
MNKRLIDKILKTLPIGWYLGAKVPVTIDDEPGSYTNLVTQEIHLSYQNLRPAMDKLGDDDKEHYEENVRCLLYHELSHVILTNRDIDDFCTDPHGYNTEMRHTIMNVFEDERIETLNRRMFLHVDFKRFIKAVCGYIPGTKPTSAYEAFFYTVRFREGKPEFVERVSAIIKEHANLAAVCGSTSNYIKYWDDVLSLYAGIENDFLASAKKDESKADKSESGSKSDEDGKPNNSESPNESKSDDAAAATEAAKNEDGKMTAGINHDAILTPEQFKAVVKRILSCYRNPKMDESIRRIIKNKLNKDNMMKGGSTGYSGKVSPMLVANDYNGTCRWFNKKQGDSLKQGSKLHLNLFIDRSSSFHDNDTSVNMILSSLDALELSEPAFSYSLVVMNERNEYIENHRNYLFCSNGGNCFDDTIIPVYRKLQTADKNASVRNIFLFDGDAWSDCFKYDRINKVNHVLAAIDNVTNTFISDRDNDWAMRRFLKKSKVIISEAFVAELTKNIMLALDSMM